MKKKDKKNCYYYITTGSFKELLNSYDKNPTTSLLKTRRNGPTEVKLIDTEKIDHIKIIVHESLSFKILNNKDRRNKYGINREKNGDLITYTIPIKSLVKSNVGGYLTLVNMKYNGDIEVLSDAGILKCAKYIFVCSKKKDIAEVLR